MFYSTDCQNYMVLISQYCVVFITKNAEFISSCFVLINQYCVVFIGKSTGKPAALNSATRTCTRGITLTHTANVGLNVGTDPWVRVQA